MIVVLSGQPPQTRKNDSFTFGDWHSLVNESYYNNNKVIVSEVQV